jgi:hypothetical protein
MLGRGDCNHYYVFPICLVTKNSLPARSAVFLVV